jgi:uncharacterized alpha-E superfamily protein
MSNTIVNFITPVIGIIGTLFGTWLGSYLTRKNNLMLEKHFMAKRIRIEKTQEILRILLDMMRQISITQSIIVKFLKGEITHDEFKRRNDEQQDKVAYFIRLLVANQAFTKSIESELENLKQTYFTFCNKIYEKYHETETKNRMFDDEDIKYDKIKQDFEQMTMQGFEIIEKVNRELEKELSDLEK